MVDLASQPTEANPQGYGSSVSVLSTRGDEGWSSQVIAPAHEHGTASPFGSEYYAFSADLSRGLVQPFGPFTALSADASESTPYLRDDYLNGNVSEHCDESCYEPLVTAVNTRPGTKFGEAVANGECPTLICGPQFVDATPDLSRVLVSSPVQLTSATAPNGGVYEWSEGKLRLVSSEFTVAGTSESSTRERLGKGHAVSVNGERVVLRGEGIYLHDMGSDETVRLDVAQGGPGVSEEPQYMTASSDASKVFFLDSGRLTADSSPSGPDLYEYDLDAPTGARLTDLTPGGNGGGAANVQAVIGASEDGSYVYFAAAGALASGATQGKCQGGAIEGGAEACNVYVSHDGVTSLVVADWEGGTEARERVRVSPDGQWLSFMSERDLSGYDTRDAQSGHPDQEVYLYSAVSGKLVCASCDPTGARPIGEDLPDGAISWVASRVPVWTYYGLGETVYQSRYLSDGGRLFFESDDALVPQDVNGTWDVYEFEPAGIGDCKSSSVTFEQSAGGCVGLISSGAAPVESSFLDASETGGDVFFLTAAKLVSADFDGAFDVYDAHECTAAVPCFANGVVSPPACSTGDSCKAAPTPQPSIFGAAPSATFLGVGNIAPGSVPPTVKAKPKSLTKAQKLSRALKACRKQSRKRRGTCEKKARKRYGTPVKSRKADAKRKVRG